MNFSYYDLVSGEILATGRAPDVETIAPRDDGEGVIFEQADTETHYVDVQTKALVRKPERTDQYSKWDRIAKQWQHAQELVPTYRDLRRAEYPPIADQLDALWAAGTEAEAMRVKVQAVKTKYPKPTGDAG